MKAASTSSKEGMSAQAGVSEPRPPAAGSAQTGWRFALRSQGALIALVLLLAFGGWRYEHFLDWPNMTNVLGTNAKFGLIAIGMAFVIMTGGIDLSVGTVAVLSSVVAALLSQHGLAIALAGGVSTGLCAGAVNGFLISHFKLMPFVVTLCTYIAARGMALVVSGRETVGVSYKSGFVAIGQDDFWGLPISVWVAGAAFIAGAVLLRWTRFGRNVLAVGGNEEAARLMGLPVERVVFSVYALSGAMAGLAGVILAAQTSGSPTEGVGWELIAIASVVVGGTLLTGGQGSIVNTLTGVLLLGVILNFINFENGHTGGPHLTLGSYWQTVVRGLFLLFVVVLQSRLVRQRR